MIVVADTGPVNYLALSGQIDLAHDLYRTFTPSTRAGVRMETSTTPCPPLARSVLPPMEKAAGEVGQLSFAFLAAGI